MKKSREFLDYVADIQEAARHIEQFIAVMTWAQFAQDQKTIYAVVRAFEIIGEAAKKIPPPVRKRYAPVSWKQMADMRDKLIHEYFGVNLPVSLPLIACHSRIVRAASSSASLAFFG